MIVGLWPLAAAFFRAGWAGSKETNDWSNKFPGLDRQQFLFTRRATVVFAVAAALSLGAVIMMHIDLILDPLSRMNRVAHLVAGVATAIGFFSLLVGMCNFWLNCDISSKLNRTVWFVVLLLGAPYGSQIAYYAFVYLPAVERDSAVRGPM